MASDNKYVTMLHGAGGSIMHSFVENFIVKHFGGIEEERTDDVDLKDLDDASTIGNIVVKSDSHAVRPLFFPGGDIGRLAISGTVNDIAVLGAKPLVLMCGLILEEGFPFVDLERVLISMRNTCIEARVKIVTGDTKVVEKGILGGCIINISGVGKRNYALDENIKIIEKYGRTLRKRWILDSNLHPGDKIILSGTIGDHGLAVLSAQDGLTFGSGIVSDVKPLNLLISHLLTDVGGVVSMKDPTRGGLSDALNEFSEKSNVGIVIEEEKVPIRTDVRNACEMLGLEPLEIGNEGKIIIGVVKEKAEDLLNLLKTFKESKDAEIIGEATKSFNGVALKTVVGGKRILPRPVGDPVPRIC